MKFCTSHKYYSTYSCDTCIVISNHTIVHRNVATPTIRLLCTPPLAMTPVTLMKRVPIVTLATTLGSLPSQQG